MDLIPKDTLAYFEAAPQRVRLNTADRSLGRLCASTKLYKSTCSEVNPDVRAVEFYATNHYYSLLSSKFTKNEPLPAWAQTLASAYHQTLVEQTERMLHYLICITTREARHLKTYKDHQKKFGELYGPEFEEFIKSILAVDEHSAITSLLTSPPTMTSGRYFRGIEYLFNVGWGTGKTSFGGPNWAAVTKPLAEFIEGKISLEMMVDVGYTLAHNNGPIFNKGMMYDSYTTYFKTLLDVQRAGMMPELIFSRQKYKDMLKLFSPGVCQMTALAYENMPEQFGQFVDWHKVEDLGALGKYKVYKDLMPKPVATVDFNGKKALAVGEFQVSLNESVKIVERMK
jgi:hypothetical protein